MKNIIMHGVGFWVGAGIPKGKRSRVYVECGCCGAYHRADFWGDCRENGERFYDVPVSARVITLDEQMEQE
jgi:hypothetical protein